jgi:hypothetical protein
MRGGGAVAFAINVRFARLIEPNGSANDVKTRGKRTDIQDDSVRSG